MAPTSSVVVCTTSRLILRKMTVEDAGYFSLIWSDPVASRFIGGLKSPSQTRRKIGAAIRHQGQRGYSRWSVTLRATGELIGLCGPLVREIGGKPEVELGYAYGRDHWGFGYATEAAGAALEHCARRLHLNRVVAIVDSENLASIRVIAKCGLQFERRVDFQGVPVNLYATSFIYSVCRGDHK